VNQKQNEAGNAKSSYNCGFDAHAAPFGKEAAPKFLLHIAWTPRQALAKTVGHEPPDIERSHIHQTFFRMSAVDICFKPLNYGERTPEFRADAWGPSVTT